MLVDRFGECYSYFSQRKTGWFILCCSVLLIGLGMIVLASASLSFVKSENYFFKQLIWCFIGVPFFLVGCLVDLDFLRRHSKKLMFIFAVALLLVLIPGIGKLVNGSRRWLSFGGINIQVSEFAKIVIIIWVATYLSDNIASINSFWRGFFIPLFIPGIVCGLILLEPDYGTTMLMGAVTFTLLFLVGARLFYLILALFAGSTGISILIYLNPTRMRRITAFLDVENNKLDGAYQLWQGMLGFASGGLNGLGIGQGRQQLVYLPEAHTDFIFSILSEEFGSIIAITVLLLYFVLFLITSWTSMRLKDNFLRFLSYGISFTIIYQVIINVGVVTGLLPTKGMVLPFISYGGSNLVLLFFMVGILLNCYSRGNNVDISESSLAHESNAILEKPYRTKL